MSLSQDDLRKVFVEEALEHLSAIENDFLSLEKAGNVFDPDLVNRVFRAAHSIKGGAGFIGLNNIKDLSHKMETVLGRYRKEKQVPGAEIINSLLLASDALKNLVANVETSDSIDISVPLEALNAIGSEAPPSPRKQPHPVPEAGSRCPSFQEIFNEMAMPDDAVLAARNEGKSIYILRLDAVHGARMNGRSHEEIMDDIKSYTTFLSSQTTSVHEPVSEESTSGRRNYLLVAFACVLSPEDVSLLLDVSRDNLFQVDAVPETASALEPGGASFDCTALASGRGFARYRIRSGEGEQRIRTQYGR